MDEVADAFVCAAILPALVSGEDIECSKVSEHLCYHFDTIMYLLGKVFGYNPVKLKAQHVVDPKFSPRAVGSGFSGGVDSFTTFINHTGNDCLDSFRITQLSLFNIGSYGNDYKKTSEAFGSDLKRAQVFANEVMLPLVDLDSNIGLLYTHKDIHHYSLRSTICISAGILSLAKLFKTYLISSTGTIDDMRLNKWDMYFYENSLTQLLSTSTTQIFIAEANLNRVEKTKLILAQKNLYVCAADICNENGTQFKKETSPNCVHCMKCARTLVTLDLLGTLPDFTTRFNIEEYEKNKVDIMQNVLNKRSYDHFSEEIYKLMLEKGWKIPSWRRYYGDWKVFLRRMRFKYFLK